MSDEEYLKKSFKAYLGYDLNLETPQTFNEKLQWLKLHDRNPLYTTLVDKVAVKEWVADRIGPEYVVPTYAVWDSVGDIDVSGLPERFVLKTNHDSGGIAICRNRAEFDLGAARKKLAKSMGRNFFYSGREWPYKDVVPRVFAEEYLEPDGPSGSALTRISEIVDYKFMCFGGEVRCAFTCTGRAEGDLRVDFFDSDWNHLPFTRHYPNADAAPECPRGLFRMVELSERLAEGIPFVRVDFYDVAGEPRFGEMTFYPGSGFEEFDPASYDLELGKWIDLGSVCAGGGWLIVNDESVMWLHAEALVKRLDSLPEGLVDYKLYCFGGEPRFLYVSKGLEEHETARISFFTMDWQFAPFGRGDYLPFEDLPQKPACFGEMVRLAKELSSGIPFVRVDLFEREGRPLFSEMTFYPCSGFMLFDPPEWDSRVGEMLDLPEAGGRNAA